MTAGCCDFCAKPTDHALSFMRCYRCKAAYYCSYAHQVLHWPKHKAQCKPAAEVVQEWYMRKYGAQDMSREEVSQRDTDFQSESDVVDLTEVFFGDEDVHIEPLQDSNTQGKTTDDKDCETHRDTEDLTAWVHGTEDDSQSNKTQDRNTHRTAMDKTDGQCKDEIEDLTELFFCGKDVLNKQQEDGNTPRTTTDDKDCETDSEREIEDITELFFGKDFPNKRRRLRDSNIQGTTTGDKECETDSEREIELIEDITEVFFGKNFPNKRRRLRDSNIQGTTMDKKDCETHSDTEDLTARVHSTEEDSQSNKIQEGNTYGTAMDKTDGQCKEEIEDLTELFFRGKDAPNKQQEDGNTPRTSTDDKDCETDSEREIEDITELFFGKDFANKRRRLRDSNTPGTTTGDKDCEADSDTEDLTAWVHGDEEDSQTNKIDSNTHHTTMDKTDGQCKEEIEDLTELFFGREDFPKKRLRARDSNTPGTTMDDKDCETESESEIEDITELFFGKDFPNKRRRLRDSNIQGTTKDDKDCEAHRDTEDITAWILGDEEDGHNSKVQEDILGDDKENTPLDDSTETETGAMDINEDNAEDLSHAAFRKTNKQPTRSQGRAKKRPLGKIARKSTSTAAIRAIFSQNCCKNNCLKKFTYKEAASCREDFWIGRNVSQAREYIMEAFGQGDYSEEGVYHIKFHLCGKAVCHKAWRKLNGITESRYYRNLRQYKRGQFWDPDHRQTNIRACTRHAEGWMEEFTADYGRKTEDSGEIVLPPFWTVFEVYESYRFDSEEWSIKPLSKTRFWKVWNANYSHVKIPHGWW